MVERGRRHTGRGLFAVVVETVVDQDGVDALRAELAEAVADRSGDLYVDCGTLNYACLDALRAFVTAAQALAAEGRRLVLVEMSPYFLEVFRATDWERTPGLVFSGTGTRSGHRAGTAAPPDPSVPPNAEPAREPTAGTQHSDVERSRHATGRPPGPGQH